MKCLRVAQSSTHREPFTSSLLEPFPIAMLAVQASRRLVNGCHAQPAQLHRPARVLLATAPPGNILHILSPFFGMRDASFLHDCQLRLTFRGSLVVLPLHCRELAL
ncbi:hypothetical protein S40293_10826 [Stachybotrys chartarum IBT 40293]|nr:hypothetical protein S40293_10826 [Stachybotrys chartarum IBT 40293]